MGLSIVLPGDAVLLNLLFDSSLFVSSCLPPYHGNTSRLFRLHCLWELHRDPLYNLIIFSVSASNISPLLVSKRRDTSTRVFETDDNGTEDGVGMLSEHPILAQRSLSLWTHSFPFFLSFLLSLSSSFSFLLVGNRCAL